MVPLPPRAELRHCPPPLLLQQGKVGARRFAPRVDHDVPARRQCRPVAAYHLAQPPPQPVARHRAAQLPRGGDAHSRFALARRRGSDEEHEMRAGAPPPVLVHGAILPPAPQPARLLARFFSRDVRHSRRPACAPWHGAGPGRPAHFCWPCARESRGFWRDGGDSVEKYVSAWPCSRCALRLPVPPLARSKSEWKPGVWGPDRAGPINGHAP